jgi:hypothetical protein
MEIESLKALRWPFDSFRAQQLGHYGLVVSRMRFAGNGPDRLRQTCGRADLVRWQKCRNALTASSIGKAGA